MMPGFEFMHLLPQAQQETVAAELPGVARGVAATGVSTATSVGGARRRRRRGGATRGTGRRNAGQSIWAAGSTSPWG